MHDFHARSLLAFPYLLLSMISAYFLNCCHKHTCNILGVIVVSTLGNRTFLIVNNSSLMKLAQMYEFIAEGPREKKQ